MIKDYVAVVVVDDDDGDIDKNKVLTIISLKVTIANITFSYFFSILRNKEDAI